MDEHKDHGKEHKVEVHSTPSVAPMTPVQGQGQGNTKLLSFLVAISLIVSVISLYGVFSLHSKLNNITGNAINNPSGDSAPNNLPGNDQPSKVAVTTGTNPAEGSKDAKVTIIEFSDFQCPYCGKFYTETMGQIRDNYVKTGKVKIYFRNFPLSFHENAEKAAEAVECAGEQNKFWEMHDKLFENQANLAVANIKQYAKDLKLDTAKFNTCLDSGKMASKVQADEADGAKFGVSGTPSFFVNGQLLVGAQPYSAFQQAIDAALAA